MKQLTISESPTSLEKEKVSPLPVPQQKISPSLDEVLTYPNPPLKTQKSKAAMPKHLSSEQVITYLEEKKEAVGPYSGILAYLVKVVTLTTPTHVANIVNEWLPCTNLWENIWCHISTLKVKFKIPLTLKS